MKTLHLDADELDLGFDQALKLANQCADHLLAPLGGAMLLSFWDDLRGLESPHGVSECHFQCPIPGWQDYAANRGGSLMVNFSRGRFVFCYRPLAVDG
ncbi:MAG: AF1514 family protein [Pseudomonadota bacterium]